MTVLFVPQTPQGAFAKKLTELEVWLTKLSGEKTKIVERSGCTVRQLLVRSNPWAQGHCGRPPGECPPCDTGDGKQSCQRRSILYETFCLRCKAQVDLEKENGTENTDNRAVNSVYTGETARTLRERMVSVKGVGATGGGHLTEYEKGLEKSHMTKHWLDCHRGEEKPQFGVKIIRSFSSCMVRQLWECIRIRRRLKEQERGEVRLLNSRSEYSRCSLPRLTVEESYEKAENETDMKEVAGEPRVNAKEKESVKVRSDSGNEPSLGKNRNLRKTNGQTQNPADIRFHFKKQNSEDKGVT